MRRHPTDFTHALSCGRPPNVVKLFPNSRALIVSGKVIDRAMLAKGQAMTIAVNARNLIIVIGALMAAQEANAAIIIEIAKSEGGANPYCALNFWNLALYVDAIMNRLGITVPVAIHADHYGIKSAKDAGTASIEIPTMFDAGLTSIAIDASHMPDDQNLQACLHLFQFIPDWSGLEVEVGEIKGKKGLSTKEEALFLIQGLNAHSIFPDWIALNNGTTHGIEASDAGIQVDLTAQIHEALAPYKVSGAQHGTSGNNYDRLRDIMARTRTTKANVATALQMISWGLRVNDYGNAIQQPSGDFIKQAGEGVTEDLWTAMVAYATKQGLKAGDYKKLNLPFENKILSQPKAIQNRMVKRVRDFVYYLLTEVFNAQGTAPLAIEAILTASKCDLESKATRLEDPAKWTDDFIREQGQALAQKQDKEGNHDD